MHEETTDDEQARHVTLRLLSPHQLAGLESHLQWVGTVFQRRVSKPMRECKEGANQCYLHQYVRRQPPPLTTTPHGEQPGDFAPGHRPEQHHNHLGECHEEAKLETLVPEHFLLQCVMGDVKHEESSHLHSGTAHPHLPAAG